MFGMKNSPLIFQELAVGKEYLTILNNAYLGGEVVAIAVRNGGTLFSPSQSESSDRGNDHGEENGSHVSGVVRILFREHGTLTLTAVDSHSLHRLSAPCQVRVAPCDEVITVLPLFTSARPISHKNSAKRDFRMKGVFATSGLTPVVISHQSIPAMVNSNSYCLCHQ